MSPTIRSLAALLVTALAACLLLFLSLALAPAPVAAAEAPKLTVEIVPPTVSPPPGRSVPVVVIVRNGPADITDVRLSWINGTEAEIARAEGEPILELEALKKTAERAWQFNVSTPPAATTGKAFLRVDYMTAGVRRVTTATLDIASTTPAALDQIAAVEIKTTLESLDEQHPGIVYLLVTNKLPTPLTVASVDAQGPDFVDPTDLEKPVEIGPRGMERIPIDVETSERVRPGKHLLLFDIHLTWGQEQDPQDAHIITTHQTQIGILGESAALTAIGVPTFLFVPGFLVLLAFASLWRFGVWRPAATFPLEVKGAEFAAAAITLSILIGAVYPRLRGIDYLGGAYGLRDVVEIWLVSILLGVALYAVTVGFVEWRRRLRTPTVNDDPRKMLKRLSRQGLELERPRYNFTAPDHTGYLIQRRNGQAKVWLSPSVKVEVKDNVPNSPALLNKLQTENRPGKLARLLRKHRHDLDISFETGAGPQGPYEREVTNLPTAQAAERVVNAQ